MLPFCKYSCSKARLESKNWKLCTDQNVKGRNSRYAYDGNIANKYRKDAVNVVSASAFFVYVIALITNRQCNLKPKERLIYSFKTIHY